MASIRCMATDVHNTEDATALYNALDGFIVGGVAGLMSMIRWMERYGTVPEGVAVWMQ